MSSPSGNTIIVVKRRRVWRHLLFGARQAASDAGSETRQRPIRTLDAIPLATVLVARSAVAGLELLSLDGRIRKAAKRLGLQLLPE